MNKKIFYIAILFISNGWLFAQTSIKWEIKTDDSELLSSIHKISLPKAFENEADFKNALENLKESLTLEGYFDVTFLHNTSDTLIVTKLTPNSRIEKINIHYADTLKIAEIIDPKIIENHAISITPKNVGTVLSKLKDFYLNHGYPFVQVSLSQIQKNENSIDCELLLDVGLPKRIDHIIVKGYPQFPVKNLNNAAKIKLPIAFDQKKIDLLDEVLQNMTYINILKESEILFSENNTDLYIYVERKQSSQIDGLLALSNTTEGKIKIYGNINLKLQNVFQKGEKIALKWLSDGNKSQILATDIEIPFIMNTPFEVKHQLNMYKKDSTFFNLDNQIFVDYTIDTYQKIGFSYKNLWSNNVQLINTMNSFDFSTNFYGVHYNYSRKSSEELFPIKLNIDQQIMSGKRDLEKQILWLTKITKFWNLHPRWWYSIENQTGLLWSKSYIDQEIFRKGGQDGFRGFREQSIATPKFSTIQNNLYFLTDETAYFSLLFDAGVYQNIEKITLFPFSLGVNYSFRVHTGIFKLEYAAGNYFNNSFTFANSFLGVNYSQFF